MAVRVMLSCENAAFRAGVLRAWRQVLALKCALLMATIRKTMEEWCDG